MKKRNIQYAMLVAALTVPTISAYGADVTTPNVTATNAQTAENTSLVHYQDVMNSSVEAYPGQITNRTPEDYRTIRVVKRGEPTKKPMVEDPSKLPIKIDADKMYYGGKSGNVWGQGKVDMYQGNRELHAPRVEGNMFTKEYKALGGYHYLEDKGRTKDLKGNVLTYNSGNGQITTDSTSGYSDPYYFKAQEGHFDGQVGHIKNGWVTTKHAMAFYSAPDYRVEGDDIEIYPGDKAVIHNARFYIKNTKILSLSKFTTSLRHDRRGQLDLMSFIPRPIYSADNGFGLRGSIYYPIGTDGEAYFKYRWFSKVGFKPDIGYKHYMPWGEASVYYSKEDKEIGARRVWIEKKPEFKVDTHTFHIGDSPITVRGGASAGYWSEDDVKGTHYMGYTEISHDSLHPIKNSDLRFYLGYQYDHYGYNGVNRTNPYWGLNFNVGVTPKLSAWLGYRENHATNTTPYTFDSIEINRNLMAGVSYKLTRLDTLSVSTQTNVQTGNMEYVDYTWHRDMHSFEGWLTYQSKQRTWQYLISAKDF